MGARRLGPLLALALLATPARGALDPPQVAAEVESAAGLFERRAYAEALTVLEALVIRLGPDGVAKHPLVLVMLGRAQMKAATPREALATLDEAMIVGRDDPPTLRYAARLRAELLASAFGTLRVRCGAGVEAVLLVEAGETRSCPAQWSPLTAGDWTLAPQPAGAPVRVALAPGTTADAALDAPAPAPPDPSTAEPAEPALGLTLRLGGGLAGIGGTTRDVPRTAVGPAARIGAAVDLPLSSARFGLGVEAGLAWSELRYEAERVEGRAEVALRWLTVEGALLGRACAALPGARGCARLGVGVGWLASAREDGPEGDDIAVRSGRDAVHIAARAGLDLHLPTDDLEWIVGVHGLYSPAPGALSFDGGALPYLRAWLDVGVGF